MNMFANALIIVVCINVMFMVVGMGSASCGADIVSKFVNVDTTNNKTTATSDFNSSMPRSLETGSIIAGSTGFSFIDGLRMIWNVLVLVLSVIIAPLLWGTCLGLPLWLQMVIGIPTFFVFVFGIIYIIRGIGS